MENYGDTMGAVGAILMPLGIVLGLIMLSFAKRSIFESDAFAELSAADQRLAFGRTLTWLRITMLTSLLGMALLIAYAITPY